MEKRRSVDQRRAAALRFLRKNARALATQGSLVCSWRKRGGRILGPYFRIAIRTEGRQRSIYLGSDSPLVAEVRSRLAELQAPRARRRLYDGILRKVKVELRRSGRELDRRLAGTGLYRKGNEIRGWSLRRCIPPMDGVVFPVPAAETPDGSQHD